MGRASEKSNIARIDTSISKRFIGTSHKKLDIGVGKRGYYYIKPWGSTTGWFELCTLCFELCRLRSCVEYREKFKSHSSNLKSQNQAQRSKHQAQSTKPKAQSPKPKAQSPTLLLTSPGRTSESWTDDPRNHCRCPETGAANLFSPH